MKNISSDLNSLMSMKVITRHGLPVSLEVDIDYMLYFPIRRAIIMNIKEPLSTSLHEQHKR